MKKKGFLKTKKVTAVFAVIAAFGGFLFLSQNITGNVVLNRQSSFNLLSLIGLLLVICAFILTAYSIKKG